MLASFVSFLFSTVTNKNRICSEADMTGTPDLDFMKLSQYVYELFVHSLQKKKSNIIIQSQTASTCLKAVCLV